MKTKPIVLCILDGIAIRENQNGNAFSKAKKPNFDRLYQNYPHTLLTACGEAVGLPEGQMGNSEVGHLNIGAGRVVNQSLVLINKAIREKTFIENESILSAINHAKTNNGKVHIYGLLSDGGVHSHINHYKATLEMIAMHNVECVSHIFLDGRDVAPDSSIGFIEELEEVIRKVNNGKIASVSGRYYSMDRDKRWERVELAYNAIALGTAPKFDSAINVVKSSYKNNLMDEFVLPANIENVDGTLKENDSVICINFRPDRSIQISYVITNKDFNEFDRKFINNVEYCAMMKYADYVNSSIAFSNPPLTNTLGIVLADRGYKQLRIAETEKYPHVTFFFDGGVDMELKNANRILIPSPKVATYDLQPEMSAIELTDRLIAALDENYDVVILNYANCDMVGHTAIEHAVIKAVETVDTCLGRVFEKVEQLGGVMLVTADHGNAEMILDDNNNPFTAHTTNPVPFIVTKKDVELKSGMVLGDIGPTILSLLEEKKPAEMTGNSIIK